ncbi:hypothetical protein HYH03_006765 [Edaphochlamys debaryana]|uniref:PROP1-like PPR domain-containing protein n=1 Tax=Edaphochlamys debaryana TaxID=47281 RepID=A0A835Y4S3_9CHLO|nr:hypothetical protein HYH03_006765 [Edaphochlamys debaryana]|eukprot:KAG2495157.1 hypothetical protein HYH03_006765 [Edaphochlamys debaryana]
MKAKPALQFARLTMGHVQQPARLLSSVLRTCAACRDVDSGMTVVELARKHGVSVGVEAMTSLIKVCKAVGNVDKAYRVYLEMRQARIRMDGHVYGALIASCAEAMKRDLTVVHERKDQYVLLERAFQYVADAESAGVALEAPVWNALMVCAGRSGELNRAFEVLSTMQRRGIVAGAATYGSLIESCVCARQPEKALRVFEVALQKGFVGEVKLYTQALSACMLPQPNAWDRAREIYSALQRGSVKPDKKFFAALMAVAGRWGRPDTALELISDMAAEGIRPSSTTVSALIHACLDVGNVAAARRVYDLCTRQGVYPVPSQFNRLMDIYASEFRFGEVVSLLCDMVAAGRQPNLNTYRILINACEYTDQAGLAFQIFRLMQVNKVQILQSKFARTIYYSLIKSCLNQTRFLWAPGGYPPTGPSNGNGPNSASSAGAGGLAVPPERRLEGEKVLTALGKHKLKGPHQSNPFDGPPDLIDWAGNALSAFHHMLQRGHRPSLETLDLLLNCLRAKMTPQDDAEPLPTSPLVPLRPRGEVFEAAFEPRALQVIDEAISRGLLPRFDPEAPFVLDMRRLPPVVAEVYVLHMLLQLERRAARKMAAAEAEAAAAAAEAAAAEGAEARASAPAAVAKARRRANYHHNITFLVPPFDPDYVKWPSYVEREMHHYTTDMSESARAKLHRRTDPKHAKARPTRAAVALAHAAALTSAPGRAATHIKMGSGSLESTDGSDVEGQGRTAAAAFSSYDELEAVLTSDDDDESAGDRDPWASEDEQASSSDDDLQIGSEYDFAGGQYVADSTTGLAVAATLMRVKVWMDMDYANGAITVAAVEVARWLKRRRQAAMRGAESLDLPAPNRAANTRAIAAAAAALAARSIAAGVGPGAPPPAVAAQELDQQQPAAHHGGHVSASGIVTGGHGMGMGVAGMGIAGARMMGRGVPGGMSAGRGLGEQQRNIRLGIMPAHESGAAAGSGANRHPSRGAHTPRNGASSRPGSAPPSIFPDGQSGSGAGPTGPGSAQAGKWRPSTSAAAAVSAFDSIAARFGSPSRTGSSLTRPEVRRPEPEQGDAAAAPSSNGQNGHGPASANGFNGSATNGSGSGSGSSRTGGLSKHWISVPVPGGSGQQAEVSVGPGTAVTLGAPPPKAAPAPEGAAAAASAAAAPAAASH